MNEINIKITRNGEVNGTVGWLAKNAAELRVSQTKDGEPGVWLFDHDGKSLECLACIDHNYGMLSLDREEESDCLLANRHYTDAAWAVLCRLIVQAKALLDEPEEMAKVFTVVINPKTPLLAAMMRAVDDDPSVRPALIDYVSNGGE